MNADKIKKYCLEKHGAYETQPFGDVPICYKLNNKIFAQLYPYDHDYKITLKCTADSMTRHPVAPVMCEECRMRRCWRECCEQH